MKYEYKAISYSYNEREQYKSTHRETVGDVGERINELGAQGWRLVEFRDHDGWLKFALMERIVTTAPAPQPAPEPAEPHICRECKYFDRNETLPCINLRRLVGPYNDACDQFTPKEQ